MCKWRTVVATAFALPICTSANGQLLASSGWEAPAWSDGPIAGQNDWIFSGTTAGHLVVDAGKNGAPAAPFGGGSRIHESVSSAKTDFLRETWGDLRDKWQARDKGNDVVHADLDFYMPASNSLDLHGFSLYNTDNFILGTIYFTAFQSTVNATSLAGSLNVSTHLTNAFATNQWNHLDIYADYSKDLFTAKINGETIAQSLFIDTGAFGDVDLSNFSVSTSSVFFTDNFRVRAESSSPAPGPNALLLFATGMGYAMMIAKRRRSETAACA